MQKQAIPKEPVASYKEVRIGKTLYRVTSVFSGEKDLGRTLEQLAVRRAMTELNAPAAAQPCHASGQRLRKSLGQPPVPKDGRSVVMAARLLSLGFSAARGLC